MASFWGTPGTTDVIQTKGSAAAKPPGFNFAKWLFGQLPGLMSSPFPTYQGNIDPGMSPTLQDAIRRAQGYAQSSPPEILAGAQGSLGRFMSPSFLNPWNRLFGGGNFGGAPNYFGVDPNQRVYGGGPAQGMTYQGQASSAPQSGSPWAGSPAPPMPSVPMPALQSMQGAASSAAPAGGGYNAIGQRSYAGAAYGSPGQQINAAADPFATGTFDPAAMAARYGVDWQRGASGFHSPDFRSMLEEELGRAPSQTEVYDAYYSQDPAMIERNRQRHANDPTVLAMAQADPTSVRGSDLRRLQRAGAIPGAGS
jgi:hypothetical protein